LGYLNSHNQGAFLNKRALIRPIHVNHLIVLIVTLKQYKQINPLVGFMFADGDPINI